MNLEPATHTTTEQQLGRLPSGRTVAATVHRYDGGAGPTVYVQAAQHGIELNGPAALRRLHDRLTTVNVAGTVVVIPVVNPPALDHRSYTTPAAFDSVNANLNRVWPGDADGTFGERVAARLWDVVTEADAVVDLHTGTADMLPHVRFREGDSRARGLATAFGTEYVLADPSDDLPDGTSGELDDFSGKFRTAAARAGIPAVTAELSNSRTVAPTAAETGADGVQNVLRELDVLPETPHVSTERTYLRDDNDPVTATEAGLFEPRPIVSVGDHLEAGEELGTIHDPSSFERRETVAVTDPGVVYSLTREATVFAGERLLAVASHQ